MSTVDKALDILDLFSESQPSVGLSEASRMLKRDKASILRYFNALESKGFVEQDPFTRAYHLGPSLARLAMIREITYPVNRAARNILKKLVVDTGETAHLSHFLNESLTQIAIEETSYRGTRVFLDPAETLTLHATASGIAYLSECSDAEIQHFLARPLEMHTPTTPGEAGSVIKMIERTRRVGFSWMDGTFETEICGIAAPVFGLSDKVCGAVAVVTPNSRMNEDVRKSIGKYVVEAAQRISRHYGVNHLPGQDTAE